MTTVQLFSVLLFVVLAAGQQSRFYSFLKANQNTHCLPSNPLSYMIYPTNYFDSIPADQRVAPPQKATQPQIVSSCGNAEIPPALLDAYSFQTERVIVGNGINLYDASTWMMAMNLLGDRDMSFFNGVILGAKTCQFQSILGDAPCKGVIVAGNCSGDCGFCYGDGPGQSLTGMQAWFFRTVSAYYSFPSEPDARCPSFGQPWVWNDWMPILGENSWIHLIGPLQMAYLSSGSIGGIPQSIIDYSVNYLTSLQKMQIPSLGAIYYAPHNTYQTDYKMGSEISTENQISTLSGLLILRQILQQRQIYPDKIAIINNIIAGIKMYLLASFDTQNFFFRNGGGWDLTRKAINWYTDFAVDCQTWTMTVLGHDRVDQWFGAGTADGIWMMTKKLGGYKFNGTVTGGLGFSNNQQDQVLSGEWTFGGINMLTLWANQTTNPDLAGMWRAEASNMRTVIDNEITINIPGNPAMTAVLYANKRYFIPFGWWSNSIPSLTSTAWATMVDSKFNPFYLGGAYDVYDF